MTDFGTPAMDSTTSDPSAALMGIAMREARALRHQYVGTEHVLLALLLDSNGGARRILNAQGLTAEQLRSELRRVPGEAGGTQAGRLPITPRTREALEAAHDAARVTRSGVLRSEHVLIAILDQEDGLARRALVHFDVAFEDCRRSATARIDEYESAHDTDSIPLAAEIPALAAFGVDVESDPREAEPPEIAPDLEERVLVTLSRRERAAALLVGPAGSGKTSLASAFARQFESNRRQRGPRRLVAIPLLELVAGARQRGKLEERVRAVFDEARQSGGCVLFLDDLDGLLAWRALADCLEVALSRRHAPVLATITPTGRDALAQSSPGLLSRFDEVALPASDETTERRILTGLARELERHHETHISAAAVATALRLSGTPRLSAARALLDTACAAKRARFCRPSESAILAFRESVQLARESDVAAAEGDDARHRERSDRARDAWTRGLQETQRTPRFEIEAQDVETIAARTRDRATRDEDGHVRTIR